jgi:hypothetical protein
VEGDAPLQVRNASPLEAAEVEVGLDADEARMDDTGYAFAFLGPVDPEEN